MISSSALDLVSFCALAAMSETQQASFVVIEDMVRADQEKVFAETLCMVSTATARSVVSAFPSNDQASALISEALLAIPTTLHSYVAGLEVLSLESVKGEIPDRTPDLERMLRFYSIHLPDSVVPDPRALRNVMVLWMGRISPPGLEEHPERRLERLKLVDRMSVHTRLVEAYARNANRVD